MLFRTRNLSIGQASQACGFWAFPSRDGLLVSRFLNLVVALKDSQGWLWPTFVAILRDPPSEWRGTVELTNSNIRVVRQKLFM